MKTKLIVAVCLVSLFAACTKTPDKTVAIQPGTPDDMQQIVKDATKQLVTACTGLNQYSYDLNKKSWSGVISNNAGNPFNYRTQNWGWDKWITVTVQVSPKAKDLPKEWNAPGRTLTYDMGGGKQPGIATRDHVSQLMCGSMAVSNDPASPDTFLSWPDLSLVDKLK